MNKERTNEREARKIVEKVLRLELEHSDKEGGVDYRSIDGHHAIEVTRVTDGRKRADRDALGVSREKGDLGGELQTYWVVFAPDTQRRLNVFLQTVHPALVELELVGEAFFDRQPAAMHVIQRGPLSPVYRRLLDAGVERASAVPNHAHRRHAHRVLPMLGSGGSSSGSDEALSLLTGELSAKKDNATKLHASGAQRRHLFVWLDDDTRFDIARPLSREAPLWRDDGFGLPSMPPTLGPVITDLWVVHQRSSLGWRWHDETWWALSDL